MSEELKPCPFCGGTDLDKQQSNTGDSVSCRCGGAVNGYYIGDLIKQWNTRADDWISVDDRLPDDDVQVIVSFNYCGRAIVGTDYYDHDYSEWLGHEYNEVTHWQPLLPPPNV